jgi:selenocysteine lyase/cysteine desulfurase
VRRAADELVAGYAREGGEATLGTLALRGRLRARLARLLGARAEDVALTTGATHGLQAVALSFPWREGDRVVLLEGEFPANVTPFLRAAQLFRLEPVFLSARDFTEGDGARGLDALDRALAAGGRLVAASAVQFQTGARMPLAAMAAVCRRRGAELCVDAIQAAGVVPVDVGALDADYVAGGAHKWLLAVQGAGYLWIRPERVAALRPALAGWLSHEEPVSFLTEGRPGLLRYDRPLRRRADVFEGGSAPSVALAALDASVAILLGLGIDAVYAHVQAFHDRLEPALRDRGFAPLRSPDPARRSGILSAAPPPATDAKWLREALLARGVVVAIPDGLVRFAPHWPNALDEVDVVLAALDDALGARR